MQYRLLLLLGLSVFTCRATRDKPKSFSPVDTRLVAKQARKKRLPLDKKSKSISKITLQKRALHSDLFMDACEGLMLLRVGDNRKRFLELYNKKHEA